MIAQKRRDAEDLGDRLISYDDALVVLPIGRTKLSELVLGNHIGSVLVGRRRLISLGSLRNFIEANTAK